MSHDLHFTTLVPEDSQRPVEIRAGFAAVRLAVVERSQARTLEPEWNRPGVYVLLDPPLLDGSWNCYVGKAPAGVAARLRQHVSNKDHWSRALLVLRDTTDGFTSTHTAWLEGELYRRLKALTNVTLHNTNTPSDDTLPAYERAALETCATAVLLALRVLGHSGIATEPVPAPVVPLSGKSNTHLAELIQEGLLPPSGEIFALSRSRPARAVINASGTVTFDGVEYPSLSSAGVAASGHKAVNGWKFWAIQQGTDVVPLATLRALHLEQHAVRRKSRR